MPLLVLVALPFDYFGISHEVQEEDSEWWPKRKSFGVLHEVSGDRSTMDALVHKISSRRKEERKSTIAEIRSLANRNTEN
ncbi:hypothetical protein DsansV1_C06g0066541 [Dioscorea sansibarensis]